jgi:hypothetical protein
MLSTKKVFPRHRNRQHAKRAKPPLGTTGVPTFFFSRLSAALLGFQYENKNVNKSFEISRVACSTKGFLRRIRSRRTQETIQSIKTNKIT